MTDFFNGETDLPDEKPGAGDENPASRRLRELLERELKVTRPVGRPRKDGSTPGGEQFDLFEELGALPYEARAQQRGGHWQLSDQEKRINGALWRWYLEEKAEWLEKQGPGTCLLIANVAMFGMRYYADIRRARAPQNQDGGTRSDSGDNGDGQVNSYAGNTSPNTAPPNAGNPGPKKRGRGRPKGSKSKRTT